MTEDKIRKYITILISYFPFLIPAIKFKIEDCKDGIAKTNGNSIFLNFSFLSLIEKDIIYGILLHEILHCFLFHTIRLGSRDLMVWNCACDFVVNDIIHEISDNHKIIKLLNGSLYDRKYHNMSAEQIYNDLMRSIKPLSNMNNKSFGPGVDANGNKSSDVVKKLSNGYNFKSDLLNPGEDYSERDLSQEIGSALNGNKAGLLAGICNRLINEIESSNIKWEKIFKLVSRQFLYYGETRSFQKPKPYCWSYGIILPGEVGYDKPKVIVIIDTSGSITKEQLTSFAGVLKDIVPRSSYVCVITSDCKVNEVVRINSVGELFKDKIKFKGGGGTNFAPALQKAEKMPNDLVIYITDGEGKFGKRPRIKNLLFILTKDCQVPFGKKILMR